jgi:hypothetical protein
MNLNLESMKPGKRESFSDIGSLLRLPGLLVSRFVSSFFK